MLENHEWQEGLAPEMVKKFQQQRNLYGVAEVDTWSFDNHLLKVLHNGLQMLAEIWHGPEEFKEKLFKQATNAHWCFDTYIELEDKIRAHYDAEYPPPEDWVETFLKEGTLKDNLPEDVKKVMYAEYNSLREERDRRKNELLDFVKENFWALWD